MSNQIITTDRSALMNLSESQYLNNLKLMIMGGRKLNDEEAKALMVYARANDMNPFNGECYYMASVGPYPGIVYYRRKAQEQILAEARLAGVEWAQTNEDYFILTETEAATVLKPGDIAAKCVLKDTLSSDKWRKSITQTAQELRQLGSADPVKDAIALVGKEPHWEGIGIVYADENFGKDRMVRLERAQKRALKMALKKRFSQIVIAEPAGADVEPSECSISVEQAEQPQLPEPDQPRQSTESILEELGYAPTPAPEHPKDVDIPQPVAVMNIEEARNYTDSHGVKYSTMPLNQLPAKHALIENAIKANGLTKEQMSELKKKRDAIRTLWYNQEPANG